MGSSHKMHDTLAKIAAMDPESCGLIDAIHIAREALAADTAAAGDAVGVVTAGFVSAHGDWRQELVLSKKEFLPSGTQVFVHPAPAVSQGTPVMFCLEFDGATLGRPTSSRQEAEEMAALIPGRRRVVGLFREAPALQANDSDAPTAPPLQLTGTPDDYASPAPDLFVYEFDAPEGGKHRSLSPASWEGKCPVHAIPYWRERRYTNPTESSSVNEAEFKNFHRLLCERFEYGHDPVHWKRDQVSLIEWIAKQVKPEAAVNEQLLDSVKLLQGIASQFARHNEKVCRAIAQADYQLEQAQDSAVVSDE